MATEIGVAAMSGKSIERLFTNEQWVSLSANVLAELDDMNRKVRAAETALLDAKRIGMKCAIELIRAELEPAPACEAEGEEEE